MTQSRMQLDRLLSSRHKLSFLYLLLLTIYLLLLLLIVEGQEEDNVLRLISHQQQKQQQKQHQLLLENTNNENEYEKEVFANQKGKTEKDDPTYNPRLLEEKKVELGLDELYYSDKIYDYQEDDQNQNKRNVAAEKSSISAASSSIIKEKEDNKNNNNNNIKAKIISSTNTRKNNNYNNNEYGKGRRNNVYVDDQYFHPRFVNFFNRTGLPKHIRDDREQYQNNYKKNSKSNSYSNSVVEEEGQRQQESNHHRNLQKYVNSDDCGVYPNPDPCCIRCLDLEYCTVLNNKYIEDTYTPGASKYQGSCKNIEDQATRLDIFGTDRTFRDTTLCRSLVYQYICLTWASDSDMYSNRCGACCSNLQDDGSEGVPLTPCRSHCLQIANVCANRLDWKELCNTIPCPPEDTTCDTGPYANNILTGYPTCYISAYHTENPASTTTGTLSLWLALGTVLISIYMFHQALVL